MSSQNGAMSSVKFRLANYIHSPESTALLGEYLAKSCGIDVEIVPVRCIHGAPARENSTHVKVA